VPRDVLEKYLAADGHSVVTAASGHEAIGCFAAGSFDLMLTDHAMPGMNGLQLAEAVHAIRAGHPVILVTGFSPEEIGTDEPLAGIDFVMRKPVPRSELRRALVSVMAT